MREALACLEELVPGLSIEDVSVVFRRASSESPLTEALEVVGNVVFQEDITKHVPKLIEKLTGADIPESLDGIVTLVVFAIVAYGILWTAQKIGKRGSAAPASLVQVEGNYNNVVVIGSQALNVSEEAIRHAVEGRFLKGRGAATSKRALDFIRPAQREEGAAVEGAGARIEPETIAAAPSPLDAEMVEDQESQDAYTDQEVVIHATDLDSSRTGWAGHLPGLWDKRLPMRLYPTVKPERLFGRRSVIADIILVSRRNLEGEFTPYLFHVVGVN